MYTWRFPTRAPTVRFSPSSILQSLVFSLLCTIYSSSKETNVNFNSNQIDYLKFDCFPCVFTCCQEGACPSGWNSIGPGCYKFTTTSLDTKKTYSQALSSCNSIGGKLFVPNSNDEWLVGKSTYVKQYIKSIVKAISPFWVGCTDQTVEGTFTCVDGTQLDINSSKFSQNLVMYIMIKTFREIKNTNIVFRKDVESFLFI